MVGRNIIDAKPEHHQILSPNSQELDLLDAHKTEDYVAENKPDLVMHCAGIVGGIQANIADPVKFLIENTEMAKNIISASVNANVSKLINLGSSCIYPKDQDTSLKESDILGGYLEPTNEGYAIAKIFALRYCQYVSRMNPEFQYKTLIPCNLYGKWDKFSEKNSHMIPAVIKKIHKAYEEGDETVEIWGDGTARREFMYAGDLADFIWYAVENFESIDDVVNVGFGYDYSILEYYQAIQKVIGFEGNFTFNLDKPVGMKRKLVDVTRIRNLGWTPKHTLEEGIRTTYEHYLENTRND